MTTTRTELAQRLDGSTEVTLFWSRSTGKLTVSVHELARGDVFELQIASDRALDGFYHPYAYAASTRVSYLAGIPQALRA
jgi:hypothetical protein